MEKESNQRPSVERRREQAEESKGRLKEQLDSEGKQSTHREIETRVNEMAERVDREKGW